MKALKIILISLAALAVVVVVGAYLAIDVIARGVIDSEGTAILGVETSVDRVDLAVFSSGSSLSGLTVANPKGFSRPDFVKVDQASIQASVSTLLSGDIRIPSVHITGLTLDLEQINDRMNASEIVSNVTANSATPDGHDDPVKLNIGTLLIEDIHLTASGSIVNIAGGHLDTRIPKLELHNLGTDTDGDQLAHQLVSMMLGVVMKHIAENPIKGLSGAAIGSVASAIENIPMIGHTGAGRTIGEALRGASKGINTQVESLGKGIKNIGDGVSKLLGQDGSKGDKASDGSKKGDSD